jgi:hypothetical protein
MLRPGVPGAAPVRLKTSDGAMVVYTLQDKCGSHDFDAEALEELGVLVGEKTLKAWLSDRSIYSFDPTVMAKEITQGGRKRLVATVLGERLQKLMRELIKDSVLTAEEAKRLLVFRRARSFRRGFLAELPRLCGKSAQTLSQVMAALGKAIPRGLKPG